MGLFPTIRKNLGSTIQQILLSEPIAETLTRNASRSAPWVLHIGTSGGASHAGEWPRLVFDVIVIAGLHLIIFMHHLCMVSGMDHHDCKCCMICINLYWASQLTCPQRWSSKWDARLSFSNFHVVGVSMAPYQPLFKHHFMWSGFQSKKGKLLCE